MVIAFWYLFLLFFLIAGFKFNPNCKHTVVNFRLFENKALFVAIILLSFIFRIIWATTIYGHDFDMECFSKWSNGILEKGIGQFYETEWCDYPPGYLYVLYVVGVVKGLLKIRDAERAYWLLLKFPAILTDIITGCVVYRLSRKNFDYFISSVFSSLWLFNPAVILDSSVWGQVDSIYTLLCAISLYCVTKKKFIPSFYTFALALLVKPQSVFFAPIIVFALAYDIFILNSFSFNRLLRYCTHILCALLTMFLFFMPFGSNPAKGISNVINQYIITLNQYNYQSMNAFNLYTALGGNMVPLNNFTNVCGYTMMLFAVVYGAYLYFRSNNPTKNYIIAFFISFSFFMLAIKMHERYAFSSMLMIYIAFIMNPTIRIRNTYLLVSFIQTSNILCVFFGLGQVPIIAQSWLNVIIYSILIFWISRECLGKAKFFMKEKIL